MRLVAQRDWGSNMDDVAAKCIQLIAEAKGIPPTGITIDTPLESLGVDSLDKVNLSFALEEYFAISIPDESLAGIRTVADMAHGIEQLRAARVA